jgi:hypothetical protein
MASATHALFLAAMRQRRQVRCIYQGLPREICPILLGRTGLEEKALVFQVGGLTSEGPLGAPDWKCFALAEVRDAALTEGPWLVGSAHSRAQHCMKMVEYDVNPLSPYNPAFRL